MVAQVSLPVFLYFTIQILQTECSLHSQFRHFEVLKHSDIHQKRVKRDTDQKEIHHLSFSALGRTFGLSLIKGSLVTVGNRVRTTLVSNHREEHVLVDTTTLFSGSIHGRPGSTVDAMYDGAWSAQIYDGVERFAIDPLARHVENDTTEDMIVYRTKDIRLANSSNEIPQFKKRNTDCVMVNDKARPSNEKAFHRPRRFRHQNDTHLKSDIRIRRQLNYYNICDVQALMDTHTFRHMGKSDVFRASKLILYWYQAANRIFTSTKFGPYRDMGIRVTSIRIFKEYSKNKSHFNSEENKVLDSNTITDDLTNYESFQSYCLGHMTTQKQITEETVGLAYTPSTTTMHNYGLCGVTRYKNVTKAYNVGVSTLRTHNELFTDTTYSVVLAHELGHNWGSHHDTDSRCSGEDDGGHYIMWWQANPGTEHNSLTFSSCSIKDIQENIKHKWRRCLLPVYAISANCGNGIVEPPEECDEGNRNVACCTDNCLLKKDADCSISVHPCCGKDCKVAPKGTPCNSVPRAPCLEEGVCSGNDFSVCPVTNRSLPNLTPCPNKGVCWYGRCLSFCEYIGHTSMPPRQLIPCLCRGDRRKMCKLCCKDAKYGRKCESTDIEMKEGSACYLGLCNDGICTHANFDMRKTPIVTFFGGQLVHIVLSLSLIIIIFWILLIYRRWVLICPSRIKFHLHTHYEKHRLKQCTY